MEDANRKDNTYCCVPQCKSKGTNPSLSFHKFPDEKSLLTVTRYGPRKVVSRRNEWIRLLKIGRNISRRMSVCSLHFQKTDYLYPSLPRKRKHLKKTAVPSLNLPASSGVNQETFAEEGDVGSERKHKNLSKKRFPLKGQKATWVKTMTRKNRELLKSSILRSEHSNESHMDRTSPSCVQLQVNTVPTVFKTFPNRRQGTPAAACDYLPQKDCTTALRYRNPSGLDANAVDVTQLTFQNTRSGNMKYVKGSSKKSELKQLIALQREIANLKTYANQLQLEHKKLVEEQHSSLVKNMHSIRQDAVEGDLMAIVLLNRIVSYTP